PVGVFSVSAPTSVGGNGGNQASNSTGTVQVGGVNKATNSTGTVQTGSTTIGTAGTPGGGGGGGAAGAASPAAGVGAAGATPAAPLSGTGAATAATGPQPVGIGTVLTPQGRTQPLSQTAAKRNTLAQVATRVRSTLPFTGIAL